MTTRWRRSTPALGGAILLALAAGCGDARAVSAPAARSATATPSLQPHGAQIDPAVSPPAGAARNTPRPPRPPRRSPASPAAQAPSRDALSRYPWLDASSPIRALDEVVAAPPGFHRVAVEDGTFAAFLRGLPLRPAGAAVRAYDGRAILGADDPRFTAVVAIDPGTRDLQQCADTAIRLHAEWLWARGRQADIGYHFTSGDLSTWVRYAAGDRPKVDGPTVAWSRSAQPASGHAAFRAYLDQVFTFAGTVSLARESAKLDRKDLRAGDLLVLPGGPGHAIVILDVAKDAEGREKALLAQGFMPAQEPHVLASAPGEPWFDLDGESLETPFWPAPFPWSSLRRMRSAGGATD